MSTSRNKSQKLKVKWRQEDLSRAFTLVDEGTPIREAARSTGVPFSTLQERLKHKNQDSPSLGRNPIFTKEQEAEMADQVKLLGKIFYGCTAIQIRKMAYEYAEKNHIPHNFNKTLEIAGRDWLKGFLKRNKLSPQKAEGTSINRATAFNKHEVSLFFELLEKVMDKYKFLPRNIYNVDETGVSSVQEPGKIIAEKGQKRVGSITSGERGKNITAVCAMSATGVYIPPMLIYPRQRHSITLEVDGPRGAIYKCSKNGWINEDLFVDWLKHFADHAKPSENEPILLVLDNHSSHISLRAYEFCKTNNIVMLSLPPHSSHRTQPMDVSVYGPLKNAYKQECNIFMKTNIGRQITHTNIASLFRKAYQKVATISKAESGFAATGIYPYNPAVFSEDDFLAAELFNTNEPIVLEEEVRRKDNQTPDIQIVTGPANLSPSSSSTASESILSQDQIIKIIDIHQPTQPCTDNNNLISLNSDDVPISQPVQANDSNKVTHFVPSMPSAKNLSLANQCIDVNKTSLVDYDNPMSSTSKQIITAKDLIPVPKQATEAKKRLRSRKQHSLIITGTPLKEALLEKENRKLAKINKNVGQAKTKKTIRQTETKNVGTKTKTAKNKMNTISKKRKYNTEIRKVKKKILQDSDSNTSNSVIEMEDLREDDDTDIDEDDQNKCLICADYGRDNEMWYRCVLCGRWAHQECSGYDSPEDYKCDLCISRA